MKSTPIERFEAKYCPEPNAGCWLWTASTNQAGYGTFYAGGGSMLAHRWSHTHFKGLIPQGLVIDHLCSTPSCVNPDHLEPVTQRENLLRGDTFQAKNAAKTHCKHGHEFSAENTITTVRRTGTERNCRACGRASRRAYLRRRASK